LARKGTAGPAGTGVGRAMGETMAVLMVAGNILMLNFSPPQNINHISLIIAKEYFYN